MNPKHGQKEMSIDSSVGGKMDEEKERMLKEAQAGPAIRRMH
jgi:hypothetical protein